ncbi:MAG: hypothetical protein AAGC93_11810 [Cyanobacteria bacterium P01_F01_bin.53]
MTALAYQDLLEDQDLEDQDLEDRTEIGPLPASGHDSGIYLPKAADNFYGSPLTAFGDRFTSG